MQKEQRFVLTERSASTATYKAGKEVINLWVIDDGTLALAFADYSFKECFNKVEKFSDDHWPWFIKDGPRLSDLEGGLDTARRWLTSAVAVRDKRNKRLCELSEIVTPRKESYPALYQVDYKSQRFHDKENRAYFTCGFWIEGKLPVVTVSTRSSSKRDDDQIPCGATPAWVSLASSINPIHDAHIGVAGLEELDSETFELLRDAFVKFKRLEWQKTPPADDDNVEK